MSRCGECGKTLDVVPVDPEADIYCNTCLVVWDRPRMAKGGS